jgi:hypothetical protein
MLRRWKIKKCGLGAQKKLKCIEKPQMSIQLLNLSTSFLNFKEKCVESNLFGKECQNLKLENFPKFLVKI